MYILSVGTGRLGALDRNVGAVRNNEGGVWVVALENEVGRIIIA